MANENWMRTYTMRCGKMGKQGFEIGNVNSVTEDCLHVSFSVEKSSEEDFHLTVSRLSLREETTAKSHRLFSEERRAAFRHTEV